MSWIKKVFTDFQTVIDAAFLNGIQDQIIADETDLANKVDKVTGKGLSTQDFTTALKNKLQALPMAETLDTELDGKVDKVEGKGLSTNDYTNAEKQRVADSALQTDLDALDDRVDQIYNGGVLYDTASGSIASFSDGADNMPVKKLVAQIEPVQAGSGDPSPDNVRPISGWTGAEVRDTPMLISFVQGGIQDVDGREVSSDARIRSDFISADLLDATINTFDLVEVSDSSIRNRYFFWYDSGKTYLGKTGNYNTQFPIPYNSNEIPNNARYFRLVLQHEDSVSNITPDGIYVAIIKKSLSVTFPSSAGTVYGGTLTLNPDRTGTLVVNKRYLTVNGGFNDKSGNAFYYQVNDLTYSPKPVSSVVNQGFISDRYSYATWNTITAGSANAFCVYRYPDWDHYRVAVQDSTYEDLASINAAFNLNPLHIVYELATPIEYSLTAEQVSGILETLYGTNNIWANTGDVTVTAPRDTKLYIEKLTQPTEDDMTADHAISSGTFFMIGNTLYLATSQIAAGGTITPGTNATKLSLADALNTLNS